ncbi:MAG TPA: hypothetical protein VJZ02_00940 [Candidatus Brocadiales bacterium]|nr:hypothetical protein [Candidatus Brocadiales bacterium]
MIKVLLGISIASLVANGILAYLWLATRKWFRLYRADLHLQGKRADVPRHLM